MKQRFIYIALILLTLVGPGCKEKKGFPKPDKLVNEKKMVDMLYDIHMSEAYANQYRFQDQLKKLESTDLYYSVLKKYDVPDSVFAQSVVYYSSKPKIYERIYQQVIDRLNMVQEERSKNQEVNIQPEK